ncbi:MAG TPA: hypothetical protein VMG12_05130 [Polyangiaceae bacterium]|nr:hypothetical protein [Polyangiaceae bacterium]
MSRRQRVPTSLLLSHLDGELGPDEEAALERRRVESPRVRQQLEGLRTLREALGAPVPTLESHELGRDLHAEAERARLRQQARREQGWLGQLRRLGQGLRRASGVQSFGLALAACALVLLGVGIGHLYPMPEEYPSERDDGFRPKSAAPESFAPNPSRWAGIQAFRLVPGGKPERLRRSVHAEDGLLFAYTNLGSEPFAHLMLFCVDAEHELHWFYPAFASEHDNPSSIPIQVGQEQALSEVIWLDLPQGPLTIYAAFTREPLDVWGVEAWFEAHPEGGVEFAGAGAAVTELAATVE